MSSRLLRLFAVACFIFELAFSMAGQSPSALPVEIRIPDRGWTFTGSDGQAHVAYEAAVTNMDNRGRKITLKRIEVLDGENSSAALATFAGTDLKAMLLRPGLEKNADVTIFNAGMRGTVWTWLNFNLKSVPAAIIHRFVFTIAGVDREIPVPCCHVQLNQHAKALAPPLRGENWVAANGPSNTSAHRRAVQAINGQLHLAQRFAIDWIRTDDPPSSSGKGNNDYPTYGKEALAVADAVVVETHDGIPENKPGSVRAVEINLDTVAGNFVVLDLGDGTYACYAHLQPGSLRVKKGDRVRTGGVIGLVGNSGNSDAPHLHFQLVDASSFLASEGVPYLLPSFTVVGTYDLEHEKFHPAAHSEHKNELPLEGVVVSFP